LLGILAAAPNATTLWLHHFNERLARQPVSVSGNQQKAMAVLVIVMVVEMLLTVLVVAVLDSIGTVRLCARMGCSR
jgi:hypothetical protein